jgi:hypothetical protein
MGQHPEPSNPNKPGEKGAPLSFPLHIESESHVELRPHFFSYGAVKDAKRRVLENLSGSGEATFVEIVTDTALPSDLASVVIGDLETEGKVTIKINEGLTWVELKK